MLVYRRVTPSPPPPSRMPAVPFYTPEWREPQWSKVPYPLKEATRRDGRGLNPRPPHLLFEVLTARPHTILVVYQFHLQVEKKGRYPILHRIPWRSCLDLYPALTTPMRWVWLKTFLAWRTLLVYTAKNLTSFGSYELIKTQIASIFGKKLKFINSFSLNIFFWL